MQEHPSSSKSAAPLGLIQESKISELLASAGDLDRLEASGVILLDGYFYVAFDNRAHIARLSTDLQPGPDNRFFGPDLDRLGYEGIGWNQNQQQFLLLVEALRQGKGKFQAEIVQYDRNFVFLQQQRLDFDFDSDNRGFESIIHLSRDGSDFVLALCEGNKCQSGKKGRKPGGGRIQVFEKHPKRWVHVETLKLPKSVCFEDYSAFAARGNRVIVVSQTTAMAWIGQFDEEQWSWIDEGRLLDFPRTQAGEVQYGNVEGVDWISDTRLVTVTDKRKKSQPKHMESTDQSIQLFEIPTKR